ncbi:MAG: radical SAM/SPASM domain-containing protein, partial [Acidimicrobiales bacterium]
MSTPVISIDIEPTNRCNAKCHFCPRDMTPHQGLMGPEVFDQALARAVEFRPIAEDQFHRKVEISLCGLGEPLLNRDTVSYVRKVRDAGFDLTLSSNASLLHEDVGRRLLDAGLGRVALNVGEEGDDYDDIYKLPFERTRDNVLRFAEMAGDDCEVIMVLVNHRNDLDHLEQMKEYWRGFGLDNFQSFNLMNRGGALFVDAMQYESLPEMAEATEALTTERGLALCHAPFVYLFIGYDGQYYLCCSDWTKEAPLGSVFDKSFLDVTAQKLQHLISREPVCRTCNLDPVNRLTGELHALKAGEVTQLDYKVHAILIDEEDQQA